MAAARYGPRWLRARLRQLLPQFPDVALCVAFSGGVDSTALLVALAGARLARGSWRALHVNHGLHPAANATSARCAQIARELAVPFKSVRVHVARERGASLEAQARAARQAAFARELRAGEVLLTAHQLDDQLETVLLQLLRGAGIAGIAAMPALARFAAGWQARPLLERSRAELETWVRARAIRWVEDPTNEDERIDRNYLRRQVLPQLRRRWPAGARSVARSARHAAEAQRLLAELGRADVARCIDGAALSVAALRTLTGERRANALRVWIDAAGVPVPDARRLAELGGPLLAARDDAHPAVQWGSVVARRHDGRLFLEPRAPAARALGALSWPWRTARKLPLPDNLGSIILRRDAHGPIDLARLPQRLTVRWRAGGEALRPRAGGPTRTLKTLLQEARVPAAERAQLPLIYARMRLIAVADRWSDASIHARGDCTARARIVWRRS
jgi:tRNA(Ile)-lysidine synthase